MAPPESAQSASDDPNLHGLGMRSRMNGTASSGVPNSGPTASVVKSPKTGLLGIRWDKVDGEIDSLNYSVEKISQKFLDDNKKNGTAIPPEVEFVVRTGEKVYKKRYTWIPVMTGLLGFAWLAYSAIMIDAMSVLTTFIVAYLWYDLFSGILHVVLDNPSVMKIPILNEPCLEFQWHHHLPHDLCSKSFLEVCGDLNLPVGIVWLVMIGPKETFLGIPFGFGLREPLAFNLMAWKLIMAYFGQLCHSMSHMPASRRPEWVNYLQNAGMMIHPKQHAQHHKTYDDKFCIGSGMWNPVVSACLRVTDKMHIACGGSTETNGYAWIVALGLGLICDVSIMTEVLRPYLG